MASSAPPAVQQAERLLVEIERTVRRFARFHKYSYGSDLRAVAMKVAKLSHRAWRDRERQAYWVERLKWATDDLKLSLQLGKRIEAFPGFAAFEELARLAADLGLGQLQRPLRTRERLAAAPALPSSLSVAAAGVCPKPFQLSPGRANHQRGDSVVMEDRAFAIHCARVYLAEASRRRHSWVNRTFYWWLFEHSQKARRQAAAMERQGELFA